jgi:hypothetical protein
MREILSVPFVIIGSCFYWIGEFVAGHKYTFRGEEVFDIIERSATYTKCGHKGVIKKVWKNSNTNS